LHGGKHALNVGAVGVRPAPEAVQAALEALL